MSDSTDSEIVSVRQAPEAASPILTEAERHKLLVEWNQTEREYPRDKCLHQLFEEQVERTPEAVAVVFEGDSLTYRELNIRANRLAHHLRSLGVGPDILVGLCVERSLEMVVALLGILKAGGAYVPLDPNYPENRLRFILKDCDFSVLLTQRSLNRLFPVPPAHVVNVDDPLPDSGFVNPACVTSPTHLDCVIYTSGSTGVPKGVAIEHHSTVSFLHWVREAFTDEELSGMLGATSICFDLSVFELFGALSWGGKIILVNNALDLHTCRHRQEVKLLNTVPSVMQTLLMSHAMPSSVVTVNLAGELLLSSLVDDLYACPHVRRVNDLYGPSETTTYSTWALRQPRQPATIGQPIANTQVYILDSFLNPTPVGIIGELCIGGQGVARGYWQRPELTAKRFIPNPFSAKPDARLYRTGDCVRWRADGNLELLGRGDLQVKIRGHRIELGEIETVLGGHPEVAACAVVAQDRGGGDKVLAAFVVGRKQAELSVGSLRLWLRQKLPDYMMPSRFVTVPSLPLNPNGKLDRKALAKLDGVELVSGTEYIAPGNERERELVEIWEAVLRRGQVGVHDNFFDLGGHSLLAAVICSRITSLLRTEVPMRWVFEHPTIEELVKQMASMARHQQNLHSIKKADRQKPLPMSFAQQGMWLLQQTLPDPATYNEPVACRLSGRVDREKVRRALQVIMERHEVLRTALVQLGENLVQQVATAKEVPLPWREVALQAVPPSQRQTNLEEQLLAEARRPFGLAQAPLWRAVWIELGGDEQVLAFTFHHSIVDEWSLRLFFQELERLYATDGQTELAGLPELPVQYADYAAWQRQRLTGELLERQRAYWREQFRDLPPALELPADRARPLRPTGQGAVYDFRIIGQVVSSLRELAHQEGTTLFTLMLTAFQVWLYRYTGQTDVVVSTPAADRERPEVQSLLGFFLNTLPIRMRLDGDSSFREVLHKVRETVLGAMSHDDLPFEQMVELAVKEREPGRQPLYQVMFVLLEEGLPPLRLDQAEARRVPMGTKTSKSDLMLSIQAVGETWDCQLEYATDLFTAETVERMARHLTELLQSIVENPQEPISLLNLMPEEERHKLLVEWNRTVREYPRDKCVHELFEEQVERTPEAVAVVFEEDSLTYRELNARSNQLARHLRSLGVGPDILVGLCVERSLEMVVALLGILKAGGAYLTFEENLPEERFRLMLADAQPRVLLVRRKSIKHLSSLAGRTPADSPTGTITVAVIEDLLESSPGEIIPNVPTNQASDRAYVSYTSGSTGRPKGVVVSHRGVVRLVKGADYVSLNAEDTLLHLSPLSFDASTFEIWGALLNGGRVVLLPPGPPSLVEIGEAIRLHGVTTLWLTAGLFHIMVDERLDDLKPLRQLLAGGDVLSPEHVRKAFHALPGCRIINGYGPTENTTFTCCYTVVDERGLAPSVPIGRPIANTQVYVLDSYLHPVPVGVAGELYAGGDGVACGYLHQPQLTAERFIPDPFSGKPDARLYRTGDCVRWRPDGNLEFLGRGDLQVKIRGYRIELGEIEAVLGAQPEVREAVVVVREDLPGDKRLTAYLVAKTGEKPDVLTMRTRVAEKLPDYMIPAAFMWLDQLPLTPNGKVDRKALLTLEASGAGAPRETSQPVNLLELELTRIWRRLFQRKDVGRQDNFFALGGHSLLAARLAAEIDKLIGCKLPIASLFQSPTIESLARRLTDENWAPPWSSLVPLQPLGSKPPLFFIHGLGGDVYGFLELAKLLPPDQPSYGIQAVGLDGKSPRHTTVEEMAAHYVKEIISFQPDGSFYLTGYSMGGLIAFEVAQQLHRFGRRVALLALLDTEPIGKTPWGFFGLAMSTYIPRRCLFHFLHLWKLPRRGRLNYLRGRWTTLRCLILSKPPPVTAPPRNDSQPSNEPGFSTYYLEVGSAYRLRPYLGSMDVFITGDETHPGWKWYWRYLVRGGVSFHRVPGRHADIILKPDYIRELAEALTIVLHRAQEKERATHSPIGHTHANLVS
jgi:amino acid adenylation domain-containing protein